MQAIQTRYLPCSNVRGSRIKAFCERGSVTIPYPHELSGDAVHILAAKTLVGKFIEEDAKQYGTPRNENPWGRHFSTGCLPNGDFAHVFID